ncbi:MAG: flagellar basal body-associated FliL family protein [Sandaracinaceae bacterium]
MADEPKKDAPEAPAPGGKNKLLVILVVTNLLVVVGAAVAVVLAMGGSSSAEAAEEEGEPTTLGPLVEISGIVVNLDEPGGTHFLRAAFQLEITDAERQPDVDARLVPIRSALMLYFSGLNLEATQGQENRAQILEQVVAIANEQIGSELVRRAYFTEFVAQ